MYPDPTPTLMVGFSTGQNTANFIPLVAYASVLISDFLIVSTMGMRSATDRLQAVLQERGIRTHLLQFDSRSGLVPENDTQWVAEQIYQYMKNQHLLENPVYWNIGGGQKMHSIALWDLYHQRTEGGHEQDLVCYADMFKGYLHEFTRAKGWSKRLLQVDVELPEILALFGYRVIESPEPQFTQGETPPASGKRLKNLWPYSEFRKYMFFTARNKKYYDEIPVENLGEDLRNLVDKLLKDRGFKKQIANNESNLEHILTVLLGDKTKGLDGLLYQRIIYSTNQRSIKFTEPELVTQLVSLLKENDNPIPKGHIIETFNRIGFMQKLFQKNLTPYVSVGIYFERIIQHLMVDLLNQHPNHRIRRAYQNVKIVTMNGSDESHDAEYDVLWLTDWGTLVVFDAKTFKFANKEVNSRQYVLQKIAGAALSFFPVIPYYTADLAEHAMSDKLKSLPFDLAQKTNKIFVLSNRSHAYWLTREAEMSDPSHIIFHNYTAHDDDPDDPEAVRCYPIQNCLQELNLLI